MILYKYRECSSTTDRIFKEQKVWLAKPNTLNDPCECSIHDLSAEWVTEKVQEMKEAQMIGALFFPKLLPSAFLKAIKATLPSIADFDTKYKEFRKLYEKHFDRTLSDPDRTFSDLDQQLNNIGIFSVASSSEHPLMWSHYGQGHKGICLGFEVRDLTPSSDPERFLAVRYSDDIPKFGREGFKQQITAFGDDKGKTVSESQIALSDETLRAAISTKATCWSYEQEWRYIEPRGAASYLFPGPLVEIVFGFRCAPEDRSHYTQLAATHLTNDIRLYEIRRIPNSFRFERILLGVCSSTKDVSAMHPQVLPEADETSIADTHPLIQTMLEQGQYSRALPALDEALTQDPASARLWRTKGVVLAHARHDEEALRCFQRAIDLYPTFFSAWYHKGVALTALCRTDEAILAYEEAHKINPFDASTIFNLACVYGAHGEMDKMKECLLAAEKAGHPRARDMLREIEHSNQDRKEEEPG